MSIVEKIKNELRFKLRMKEAGWLSPSLIRRQYVVIRLMKKIEIAVEKANESQTYFWKKKQFKIIIMYISKLVKFSVYWQQWRKVEVVH